MHKNLKKTLKIWHISSCVLVERIFIQGSWSQLAGTSRRQWKVASEATAVCSKWSTHVIDYLVTLLMFLPSLLY